MKLRHVLLLLALAVGLPMSARAQDGPSAVEKWLNEESSLGNRLQDDVRIEARWTKWVRVEPDAATAEALSRDLSKTPDHPLAARQAEMRRQIAEGVTTRRSLATGDDRWRIAYEEPGKPGMEWVSGGTPKDGWMWSDDVVTIVQREHPPEAQPYPSLRFEYINDLLNLLTGGLADVPPARRTWKCNSFTGTEWTASGSGEGGVTFRAQGDWDQAARRGRVRRVEAMNAKGATLYVILPEDWKMIDGMEAASKVELQVGGKPAERCSLEHLGRLEKTRLQALCAVPDPRRADPVLGDTASLKLVDLRSSIPNIQTLTPSGLADIPIVETPEVKARRRLRWAGWGVGAGTVISVIAIWKFRRRAA